MIRTLDDRERLNYYEPINCQEKPIIWSFSTLLLTLLFISWKDGTHGFNHESKSSLIHAALIDVCNYKYFLLFHLLSDEYILIFAGIKKILSE